MSDSVDKVRPTTLTKLLSQPQPFLTVHTLNEIASECDTSYSEIVRRVQGCRNGSVSMNQCIVKIVKTFRPELLD
jgi:hypothetical protein